MKVDGKVKVDGNELTEFGKMVDGMIQYSNDDQVDNQVLTEKRPRVKERLSIDGKPCVEQRSCVDKRPRIDKIEFQNTLCGRKT